MADTVKKKRIYSLSLIALLLLSMIFFSQPLVKMGASARILTVSMKGQQALEMSMILEAGHLGFIMTLINVLYIAAMILALIPVLTAGFRRGFLVASKITPILTLVLFVLLMIVVSVALGEENSDLGQDVYRFHLTFQAYIYLISNVLAIVLSFFLSHSIKKSAGEEKTE